MEDQPIPQNVPQQPVEQIPQQQMPVYQDVPPGYGPAPKSKLPMIIGVVVVIALVLVAAFFVLTGEDTPEMTYAEFLDLYDTDGDGDIYDEEVFDLPGFRDGDRITIVDKIIYMEYEEGHTIFLLESTGGTEMEDFPFAVNRDLTDKYDIGDTLIETITIEERTIEGETIEGYDIFIFIMVQQYSEDLPEGIVAMSFDVEQVTVTGSEGWLVRVVAGDIENTTTVSWYVEDSIGVQQTVTIVWNGEADGKINAGDSFFIADATYALEDNVFIIATGGNPVSATLEA